MWLDFLGGVLSLRDVWTVFIKKAVPYERQLLNVNYFKLFAIKLMIFSTFSGG